MNEDFLDVLESLLRTGARFLIVGAHAMAAHGVPRATGDLDIWVDTEPPNSERVWRALVEFGAPISEMGISRTDLESPGIVVQLGSPPRRIDILTEISGVGFAEAWADRTIHQVGHLEVPFLGRKALARNKRATGRSKDLADLEVLGEND